MEARKKRGHRWYSIHWKTVIFTGWKKMAPSKDAWPMGELTPPIPNCVHSDERTKLNETKLTRNEALSV